VCTRGGTLLEFSKSSLDAGMCKGGPLCRPPVGDRSFNPVTVVAPREAGPSRPLPAERKHPP
jgi:hypothetical protein